MKNSQKENFYTIAPETDNKDLNSKNEELVIRKEIKNTPFTIIGVKEEFFGVMGEYRITEPYKTEKEVEKELKKITWNRIVQVMMIILEKQDDIKKFTNNQNQ